MIDENSTPADVRAWSIEQIKKWETPDGLKASITLQYDEVQPLVTLLADVHHGHGTDPELMKAAAAFHALVVGRASANAGVARHQSEHDLRRVRLVRDRPRPWDPLEGWR